MAYHDIRESVKTCPKKILVCFMKETFNIKYTKFVKGYMFTLAAASIACIVLRKKKQCAPYLVQNKCYYLVSLCRWCQLFQYKIGVPYLNKITKLPILPKTKYFAWNWQLGGFSNHMDDLNWYYFETFVNTYMIFP